MKFIFILFLLIHQTFSKKKILCLHGGNSTAGAFQSQTGMKNLMASLDSNKYEFVFANTPENNGVWIKDPPGGKEKPTTNESWADLSIQDLNDFIRLQGPFYAILGYSQGAAMSIVYVSENPNKFEKVLLFNGYLPTTHQGLMDKINRNSPIQTPTLIFIGQQDYVFKDLGYNIKSKFANHVEINSTKAGHHLPYTIDPTFQKVINFILTMSCKESIQAYCSSNIDTVKETLNNLNNCSAVTNTPEEENDPIQVNFGFGQVRACKGDNVTVNWQGYHNIHEVSNQDCNSDSKGVIEPNYFTNGKIKTYNLGAKPGETRYFKCDLHCSSRGARFEISCPASTPTCEDAIRNQCNSSISTVIEALENLNCDS